MGHSRCSVKGKLSYSFLLLTMGACQKILISNGPVIHICWWILKLRPNLHLLGPVLLSEARDIDQVPLSFSWKPRITNPLNSICVIFFLRLSQILFPCGHHFLVITCLFYDSVIFSFAISSSDFPFSPQIPRLSQQPSPEFSHSALLSHPKQTAIHLSFVNEVKIVDNNHFYLF